MSVHDRAVLALLKNRLIAWAKRLWYRVVCIAIALYENDAPGKASEMAFWVFLGLVPLFAILGYALAQFAGAEVQHSIIASLFDIAPRPAAELVQQQLVRLSEQGVSVAPVSAIGFVWIASGGAHTAMSAIQMSQAGEPRPWWINRSLSIVAVIAFLIVVTASTVLLILGAPPVQRLAPYELIEAGWLQVVRYGRLPMATTLAALGAAIFYSISTYRLRPQQKKRVWPGAIVTAVSWVLISWGFSAYVGSIGRFPIFYGSLAAVALLLLWLWVSSFLVLLGSEVNLQLDGMREPLVASRLFPWQRQEQEASQRDVESGKAEHPPTMRSPEPPSGPGIAS